MKLIKYPHDNYVTGMSTPYSIRQLKKTFFGNYRGGKTQQIKYQIHML